MVNSMEAGLCLSGFSRSGNVGFQHILAELFMNKVSNTKEIKKGRKQEQQNDTEIPSHPSHNGYHQESIKQMLLIEDVGECKLVLLPWKSVWRFLNKLIIELPYAPAVPLLGIDLKESSGLTVEIPAHSCLLKHNSQ
jgi:hypothetical protein